MKKTSILFIIHNFWLIPIPNFIYRRLFCCFYPFFETFWYESGAKATYAVYFQENTFLVFPVQYLSFNAFERAVNDADVVAF